MSSDARPVRYTAVETENGGLVLDNWLNWWAEFGSLEAAIWAAVFYEAGWLSHNSHRWQSEQGPPAYGPMARAWAV